MPATILYDDPWNDPFFALMHSGSSSFIPGATMPPGQPATPCLWVPMMRDKPPAKPALPPRHNLPGLSSQFHTAGSTTLGLQRRRPRPGTYTRVLQLDSKGTECTAPALLTPGSSRLRPTTRSSIAVDWSRTTRISSSARPGSSRYTSFRLLTSSPAPTSNTVVNATCVPARAPRSHPRLWGSLPWRKLQLFLVLTAYRQRRPSQFKIGHFRKRQEPGRDYW